MNILTKIMAATFCLAAAVDGCGSFSASAAKTTAERHGWELSTQSYTFHNFTVFEALDKTASLGLKNIEIYPGHRLGGDYGDATFGYGMTPEQRDAVLRYAKDKGVKIVGSGVWVAGRDEWQKVFDFAGQMGLEYISAEPAREDWDVVEALADKTGIRVATHNHPDKNSYWNADELLTFIGHRSRKLGSCTDVGHFRRMDLDHLDQMRRLDGRILSLHFKDIAPDKDGKLEDCVWGEGILGLDDMLKELKRQKFKGYFTIEYENEWDNNVPSIARCIKAFNSAVDRIF